MPNKIYLRRDIYPTEHQLAEAQKQVIIFAPDWVKDALGQFLPSLQGRSFQVFNTDPKDTAVLHEFKVSDSISLKQLQLMARNEESNVSGVIAWAAYENDLAKDVIISLKDLVRQCVLIGRETTTHYGGYPGSNPKVPQVQDVYICDLAALQFQKKENSGRLVLYKDSSPAGMLDDFIFENVVGEARRTYTEVRRMINRKENDYERYVECKNYSSGKPEYFDTVAYQRFVALDVMLTAKAIRNVATEPVNFKFLKYGTGFFAGNYRTVIEMNILRGVVSGLEKLFAEDENIKKIIQSVEFPFYEQPAQGSELSARLKKLQISFTFSRDDALKKHPSLVNAVTNCGDPHALLGNEMGYSSVDAAIAENLKSKGVAFSPALNDLMTEEFIQIKI